MLTQSTPLGNAWSDMLARLEDERIMLQRIAAGEPLSQVLEHVLRVVEAQSSVPLHTSILFVDEDRRLRAGISPSLPADYLAQIDGTAIGPDGASWAQAADSGEPVYAVDISEHANWAPWRAATIALGLRCCWSTPIKRPDGQMLGVFSNYYARRRLPSAHDIEAIALVTRTLALAIERHRTEQALRQSAQRWRNMFEGMQEGFFLAEAIRDEQGSLRDFRLLEVNPAFEQQCGYAGRCLGRTLREVFGHAPPQMMDVFARVMETGESAQTEYCVPGPVPAWYEVRSRKDGPQRLTAMLLDVSARKVAEAELWDEQRHKSFQLALGDRLRLLEQPGLIEETVCEALGRHLELNLVCILRLNAEGEGMEVVAGWSPAGEPEAPSPTVQLAVSEALSADRSLSLQALAGPAEDGLIVPLARWGQPRCGLLVRSNRGGRLRTADQDCVEEVAERLCDALERTAHASQLEERVEHAIAERDRIWRLSPEMLALMDSRGRFLSVSPAVRAILGWTPEQFLAMGFSTLVHPEDRQATRKALNDALLNDRAGLHHMESRLRKRDGDYGWINWTMSAAQGHLYLAGRDDTHVKEQAKALSEAETALRQAQKLEAVGRLTGGIAHDFNNMLQGISGALYMMERRLDGGRIEGIRRYIGLANDACTRAAQLTQRLLTFSRRQPIDPRPCDTGDMLLSMVDLFRRYTGERVELKFDLAADVWPVCCDNNQFESVVLNLVINACDAMPDGGCISLSTRNVELGAASLRRFPDAAPGDYVEVAIADTGSGMSPDVLSHAVEPFFTTKPVGSGTGLGLSTSYGFAQQAGGALTIESQPQTGTTVRLWLPRHRGQRGAEVLRLQAAHKPGTLRDQAIVLLVEDDSSVREMVLEAIAELEVSVICATDGLEGARRAIEAERIDLLVSDIGLPGLDGRQVAARAREAHPELRVLFMTGYAEGAAKDPTLRGEHMDLILKPFSLDTLTARVQWLLGGQRIGPEAARTA